MMDRDVQAFRRNRFSSQSMRCAQFLASLGGAAGTACIWNDPKEQTIRKLLLRPRLASAIRELKEHAVTACIDSKSRSRWRLAFFACRSVSTSIKAGSSRPRLARVAGPRQYPADLLAHAIAQPASAFADQNCGRTATVENVHSRWHKSVVEKYNRK
jgi:hypothetical protein